MDPLALLREYVMRQDLDSVKQVGDEIYFGNQYRYPCSIETAYRSKQGHLYTLYCLVFFMKNAKDLRHTEYMQKAHSLKLQNVVFTDRKPLLDYLEGRVQTTESIELLAPSANAPALLDRSGLHYVTPTDDVEEYRPDDPVLGLSKRPRLEPEVATGMASDSLEAEMDPSRLISYIRGRERPIRDRNTILLCHNKDFHGIVALLTRREDEKRKVEKETDKGGRDTPVLAPKPSNRYANVEEKRFWKEHLGTDAAEELGIDPTQSYIAGSAKPKDVSTSTPRPPRPPSAHPHTHTHTQSTPRPHPHPQSTPRPPPSPLPGQKAKADGPPIILVPSAFQTMLNMFNAKDLLEDGVYVAPDVKAKMSPKKPDMIVFHRKMGRDVPVKYEVRDKTASFSSKDWERVVAVFVLGKEWQFKDWPFKGHMEVFTKMQGILLRYEDDPTESTKVARQWNVKVISLSKHKRHQDRTAMLELWETIDAFIRAHRMNVVF